MTFIIDRFEGDIAVIEAEGNAYNIPRIILPENANEGDVITTSIDKVETENRKQEARALLDSLFNERK